MDLVVMPKDQEARRRADMLARRTMLWRGRGGDMLMVAAHIPPRPPRTDLSMALAMLPRDSQKSREMGADFVDEWRHTLFAPHVRAIYELQPRHREILLRKVAANTPRGLRPYNMIMATPLYHGTQRACLIGETTNRPCTNTDCYLCCILRDSFRLRHCNRSMFGRGIYSTPTSSKADRFARNRRIRSTSHAILVCSVVRGRRQFLANADPTRTCPDRGYDSVESLTRPQGGPLNYRETVVYREDAILPLAVIVYTRKEALS